MGHAHILLDELWL